MVDFRNKKCVPKILKSVNFKVFWRKNGVFMCGNVFFVHVSDRRSEKHPENSKLFSKSRFRKKQALKKKIRRKRIFFSGRLKVTSNFVWKFSGCEPTVAEILVTRGQWHFDFSSRSENRVHEMSWFSTYFRTKIIMLT